MAKTLRTLSATGFTTKNNTLSWEELDQNFIDLFNDAQNRIEAVDSAQTITVGSGGDYSTINDALAAATALRPKYAEGGLAVTVRLLSGFTMSEQVRVLDQDLSWIKISSVDATVTIDRASITTTFQSQKAAFNVRNGKLPSITCAFSMNTTGTADNQNGVYCRDGSVYFSSVAKMENCTGSNVQVVGGTFFAESGAEFDGAVNGDGLDLSGCAAYIEGVQANSNGRHGIQADNARVSASGSTASSNGSSGFAAFNGAIIDVGPTTATGNGVSNYRADRAFLVDESELQPFLGDDGEKLQTKLAAKAAVAGDATQTFSVGTATSAAHAMRKGQTETLLAQKVGLVSTTQTITVGSGGDYSTINAAFEAASKLRPEYVSDGVTIEVRLLTGFTMAEQVFVVNQDLSHVTLTSADAEVTITRSALTTAFETVHYPAFGFRNSRSPIFDVLFNMDSSGTATYRSGVVAEQGSFVYFKFESGAGFKNAGQYNLLIRRNSGISAKDCIFTGAGDNGMDTEAYAYGWLRGCDFSNAGRAGVRLMAAFFDLNGVTANDCATRGINAARSWARASAVTITGALSRGIVSQWGSRVILDGSATVTGSADKDLFVQTGGEIYAAGTATWGTSNIQPNTWMHDGTAANHGFIWDESVPAPSFKGYETLTVGSGGNYSTLGEALEYLSAVKKMYNATEGDTGTNIYARVELQSDYTMSEQITVIDQDLSWVRIDSELDATVTIDRASISTTFEGQKAAFQARNGKLPVFNCPFSMNTTGTADNQNGVWVTGNSEVSFTSIGAMSSCTGSNVTVTGGSLFAESGATFNSAVNGDGLDIDAGAKAKVEGITASSNGRHGIQAGGGSVVSASGSTASSNGSSGFAAFNGAIIDVSSTTATGNTSSNYRADRATLVDADELQLYLSDDGKKLQDILGLQMADQWRLTTSFTGDANPITTNLAQSGTGQIGGAMTQTSGEFTFPSTGKYLIIFQASFSYAGDTAFGSAIINTATDGSTFGIAANVSASITQVGAVTTYGNAQALCFFDVTSTSTHKCSFRIDVQDNSTTTRGSSSLNETAMFFIKLGET